MLHASEGVRCYGNRIRKQVFKCELLEEEQLGAANFFTAVKIYLRLSVFVNFTYGSNCQKNWQPKMQSKAKKGW